MFAWSAYRGDPPRHLIGWKYPTAGLGYYATLGVKVAVLALVGFNLVTDVKLLGEKPAIVAVLVMLAYLWVGIFIRFRNPPEENPPATHS